MERALVIAAHADDIEFSAAGTVARWVAEGADVAYVLCTDGSKGTSDPTMQPEVLAKIRREEQLAAAARLGVKEVMFLDYEDGVLEPSIDLRRDIVRAIRKFRPDAVVCMDPTVRWYGRSYINHPDHIAVGNAVLAAVYPSARDRWVFPELLAEGLEPHKTRDLYLMSTSEPDVWIDITETIELKIAALMEHKTQITDPSVAEFVRDWGRRAGEGRGMAYAEAFRYFRLD